MRAFKEIAYWLLGRSGLASLAAWFNRGKTLVLVYHDVYAGTRDPVENFDGMRVRVEQFEKQMRYLAARYCVVPLDQLLDAQAGRRNGRPLAAITFDDGYRNMYRYAYPVLRQLSLPATVFVMTDFSLCGQPPWWDRVRAMVAATRRPVMRVPLQRTVRNFPLVTVEEKQDSLRQLVREIQGYAPARREALLAELAEELKVAPHELKICEPLSASEIREMADGLMSVGSHGCSHDSFLRLSRDRLVQELVESKRLLEVVTGRHVSWVAYPFGDFSQEIVEAVIQAGYRGGLTTIEGLNGETPDLYAVRRIGVDDNMSFAHFLVMVSGLRDFLKSCLWIGRLGRPRRTLPGLLRQSAPADGRGTRDVSELDRIS